MAVEITVMYNYYSVTAGASWSVPLTHYRAGDKIEKNEIAGACSSDGGGERRVQGFRGET
jgi:hypothetical protein